MRLQTKLALALVPLVLAPVLALGWITWEALRVEMATGGGAELFAASAEGLGLAPLRLAANVLAVTLLSGLLVVVVLFGWLRRLVLRPIRQLQEAARRIGDGELRTPIAVPGDDEIASLGQALRDMGGRLADYRDRVEHLAFHDPLTDLPNRVLIRELLAEQLRESARRGRMLAVLFLDLDNFKQINDNLGHAAGDHLLRVMVARISSMLNGFATNPGRRGRIHLARFGGDELLISIGELATSNLAAELADLVLAAVAEPVDLDDGHYVVTASIGIALAPRDATDADGLVRCADLAMYQAKADGRDTFRFFSAELNSRAAERLTIERRLRRAVAEDRLAVHYQPVVNLADGQVCGFEALLRWQDPELGQVAPARFIPVAEDTGLIQALGLWVLERVCAQLVDWRAAGLTPVPVAINISAAQLRREDLAGPIRRALHRHGLAPADLVLELTESTLLDQGRETLERVRALESLGIPLAIDDFGTGYSSLSYLRRFRIATLKIDRSFVSNLGDSAGDRSLVAAITAMARALDVAVVAEGIETAEQLAYVQDSGCGMGQGWLFGYPAEAAAATALLRQARPAGRAAVPQVALPHPARAGPAIWRG